MLTLKVVLKCVISGALIATGTVLLVLPGPGIPLIVAGVALLATEFEWAARLQRYGISVWNRIWRRPALASS